MARVYSYSTHLINRFPSGILQGKTPYQVLFGKEPSYEELKSFGYLCYSNTLSQHRTKFDSRAITCVLLGYSQGQKGYKVLDIESNKVFISRDVHFHEHIFSLASKQPLHKNSLFHTEFSTIPLPQDHAYAEPDPHNSQPPPIVDSQ